ncbi:MAG: DUF4013 domain-containing protein [Planctomycetaceae bacterium]|nr:DUF4013 domain-containing protein [Planctomycetaceae bacterium]
MSQPVPPYMQQPYQPPFAKPTGPQLSPSAGLKYGEMFSHIFQNPDWFTNVLLCGVCFLIPIVGPIVLLGYRYEVIDHWNRQPGFGYPNFDFGKFGLYLGRGIWPFLVGMIAGCVTLPLVLVVYVMFVLIVGIAGSIGPDFAFFGVVFGFLFLMLGIVLSLAVVGIITVPMEIMAGIRKDLGASFDIGFIKDFIRLTWKETLLGFVFLYIANMALAIVGMLLFCIGIYFTMAIAVMAQTHFEHQLYLLYLSRGGRPIPGPYNTGGQYPGRAPSGW